MRRIEVLLTEDQIELLINAVDVAADQVWGNERQGLLEVRALLAWEIGE